MPTELEDLVEFLHHGNSQIRQIATENLVGYSTADPNLFKRNQLEPIRDLKLLIKDYKEIAPNALTMLVNLSDDDEVVKCLIDDKDFLESLLLRVTSQKQPNADLQCMLLANLAKSSSITTLLTLKRSIPKPLSTSPIAIDQLLDCFVRGSNPAATYDYLSYLFADISKHASGRAHFLSPRAEDSSIIPLTKLIVFTEAKSTIRRRGVANTIKNACFSTAAHPSLLSSDSDDAINLLPYILLPLMGSESYSDEDSEGMLDECQLLDPDKAREPQPDIMVTHLETLLLLTTTAEGRKRLRDVQVYPIVRELHAQVESEEVREACDRLVQVLMRGEEGEEREDERGLRDAGQAQGGWVGAGRVEEVKDEDEEIVDVV